VRERADDRHRQALERFYEAFNARDLPAMLAEMHPDIEFESRFARAGATTYRGPEGVRGWIADLADAWEQIVAELGDSYEPDEDLTIALITLRGKRREGGVELNERATLEVRWREGKLVRLRYAERDHPGLEM